MIQPPVRPEVTAVKDPSKASAIPVPLIESIPPTPYTGPPPPPRAPSPPPYVHPWEEETPSGESNPPPPPQVSAPAEAVLSPATIPAPPGPSSPEPRARSSDLRCQGHGPWPKAKVYKSRICHPDGRRRCAHRYRSRHRHFTDGGKTSARCNSTSAVVSATTTSSASTTVPRTTVPRTTVPPTTVPPTTVPPAPTAAQYEASCTNSPAYGELSSPNAAQGTCVNYQAQVFQYDSNTGSTEMLVDVTNDGYGLWTNAVELQLAPSVVAQNLIQNDVIRFWGTTSGSVSYATEAGGTNTVPVVDVEDATLVSAASS